MKLTTIHTWQEITLIIYREHILLKQFRRLHWRYYRNFSHQNMLLLFRRLIIDVFSIHFSWLWVGRSIFVSIFVAGSTSRSDCRLVHCTDVFTLRRCRNFLNISVGLRNSWLPVFCCISSSPFSVLLVDLALVIEHLHSLCGIFF